MRLSKVVSSIFMVHLSTIAVVYVSIAEEGSVKVVRAARIGSHESPVIDGKLDDECWEKAHRAAGFIQFEPIPGGKPRDPTNVYVLFDREKLYVAFECFKKDPDRVLGTQMRRDSHFFQDDFVEVFLDTYHDRRNCYGFAVNCLGTQVDRRIANEGSGGGRGPRGDRSRAWDCAWVASAAKTEKGWAAEMAIPFSELRFDKKGDGTWGINFWRSNEEFDEEDTWADVGEREYTVSKFGHLVGLTPEDLVVSRPIEFKPYGAVKPKTNPEWEIKPDAGLDIRYPSSTITADFTFNPDFAQVEADPSRINLEDVEMRLSEKRPFFQEGMELFQTPIELFYTRRVGLEDLRYGAKAVGKLGGYNIALLDCQSDDTEEEEEEEEERTEEEKAQEGKEENDERENNYLVLRAQRDVGANSSIGFLGVNKQKADGYNRLGGVDLNIALPANMRLMGQYAYAGKSYRYWGWSDEDPQHPILLRGEKSDDAFTMNLDGRTKSLSFELSYGDIGPDFAVESGFIPRTDRRGFSGRGRYEYTRDARIFRMFSIRIGQERLWNHGGAKNDDGLWDHDSIKTNDRWGIDGMVRISDFFISVEPQWYRYIEREDDKDNENVFYTDRTISSFIGWFPPRWASIRLRTHMGKQKREEKKIPFVTREMQTMEEEVMVEEESKWIFFVGPEVSITPIEKLRLELEMERMDREGETFELNRRLKLNYQFSHRMFLRTTFEVNRIVEGGTFPQPVSLRSIFWAESGDEWNIFALYGWEFHPESNFFLVYTANVTGDDVEMIMFVKLSYLLKWCIF